MNGEDILESIAWAIPFLVIAAVFYAIAAWKKSKGRGLHRQAQLLLSSGRRNEARDVLLQALWKANEEPNLERQILADLGRLYGEIGTPFSPDDYEVLIGQYKQLKKKGSHKAISEMKKVQALKKELIDRMPRVA
jgi:hypothetical protein